MLQTRLLLLATFVGLCLAETTSNAVLISALVFAILACILATITCGYLMYRNKNYKMGAKQVKEMLSPGEVGVNGGAYRSGYYGDSHWYTTDDDDYDWLWIGLAVFCCIFWVVVIGLFIWWLTTL